MGGGWWVAGAARKRRQTKTKKKKNWKTSLAAERKGCDVTKGADTLSEGGRAAPLVGFQLLGTRSTSDKAPVLAGGWKQRAKSAGVNTTTTTTTTNRFNTKKKKDQSLDLTQVSKGSD